MQKHFYQQLQACILLYYHQHVKSCFSTFGREVLMLLTNQSGTNQLFILRVNNHKLLHNYKQQVHE